MINKSATRIGTVSFKTTGLKNTLHIGTNSNTGYTIIWQQVEGCRSSRITGRNLAKFAKQLNDALNQGEATWVGTRNDAALDCLMIFLED